jgi:hypothetical protein
MISTRGDDQSFIHKQSLRFDLECFKKFLVRLAKKCCYRNEQVTGMVQ